jgi:hypothetical protein
MSIGRSVPRVLFIGGLGRSGSTLLDLMLGQQPGFCAVGELSYIWLRGVAENELCGCGERFRDCPFWSDVGQRAFGGWDRIDAREVVELKRSVDRNRFIPLLLAPRASRAYTVRLGRYTDLESKLYGAIHDATGGATIVDSTKHPSAAFVLSRVPGMDVRIVHLVRDSRGVAYSWTKEVRKPEVTGRDAYLDTYAPSRIAARWLGYNVLLHVVRAKRSIRSIFLRYEDLVARPRAAVARVATMCGASISPGAVHGVGADWVELNASHTIAGNPIRFTRPRLDLRLDVEWCDRMPLKHRIAVSGITWPLLGAYRYLANGSSWNGLRHNAGRGA